MIRGTVNARSEPVLSLRVRGPVGLEVDVNAVLDTGSTSAWTLPPAIVAALGLTHRASAPSMLADGTVRSFDTSDAEVDWDGVWRALPITEIDAGPLLGTGLRTGHEVFIEFVPGGVVDITRIP